MKEHAESQIEAGAEGGDAPWKTLATFDIPSQPGMERQAIERVSQAIEALHLPEEKLERIKTAVAEAAMNGIEHGNHYHPELPVGVTVRVSGRALSITIIDQGVGDIHPEPEVPDIEAKLAGLQSPRGWGLFLIQKMVDEMRVSDTATHHTIEMIVYL